MPIRNYADIENLEGDSALSDAELKLIKNCRDGELTALGDGSLPDGPSRERTIRADLLRYLILGGCSNCRVHERGVLLRGAWIQDTLDLSFAHAKGAVNLDQCGFENTIKARQAKFHFLTLNGSNLPGLDAHGSTIKGSVFLRDIKSTAGVSFVGATIGGQLSVVGLRSSAAMGRRLMLSAPSSNADCFLTD